MIKALIVDDEKNCSEALQILLQENCPGVTVIGVAHSGMEALAMIEAHQPQLVFLDIEMPHMTGFQVLERLPRINFELIFTTSYDQYAIKAFKFSALDYLLKPIDREELETAVAKVTEDRKAGRRASAAVGHSSSENQSAIPLSAAHSPAYPAGIGDGTGKRHHSLRSQQQLHRVLFNREKKDPGIAYAEGV